MIDQGHALRITTRTEEGRSAIQDIGAECWIGTPDRLATLRGALDRVAIACWLLAQVQGEAHEVAELHSSRLQFFLSQAIDTTVRGLIYDATPGCVPEDVLEDGAKTFTEIAELNAIPAVVLRSGEDENAWLDEAERTVQSLLRS